MRDKQTRVNKEIDMDNKRRILSFDAEKFPRWIKQRPVILLCLAVFILGSSIWIFVEWITKGGGVIPLATGIFCLIFGISGMLAWKQLKFQKNN